MRRNKIKPKYLSMIRVNNNSSRISNTIDIFEKKLIKGSISFLLIILMIFWGIVPIIVLNFIGIDLKNLTTSSTIIISFISDLLFLGLIVGIYYKTLKKDFNKYFNRNFKENLKTSVYYWLVGLGIMYISNIAIAIVMNGQLTENEESVRSLVNMAPLYMVFQLVIYAPIVEELIFRKSIRDVFDNKVLFTIISGLIFGGLHIITSITNLTSLIYLIPYCSLGIAFGLLYVKSDNIFSSIISHTIHNSLALIIYLLTL